jgi:hypothetical protein
MTGLLGLSVHFIFLFIGGNPFSNHRSKLAYWAQHYSYPYFFQTWSLFAPPPTSNFQLIARFNFNGKTTTEDIFSNLLHAHQANRFAGGEPLLLTFVNSLHYYEKATRQQNALNNVEPDDINFKIVETAARGYLHHKYRMPVKNLRLFLIVTDVVSNRQRVYVNGHKEVLCFAKTYVYF